MKKLIFAAVATAFAYQANADDFAPFPLSIATPGDLTPAEPPVITPGIEYVLNPCAYVYVEAGYICLPTENGGFIVVPAGGAVQSQDDLFGFTLDSSTSLVVDEDDLDGIPPHLWPYIRQIEQRDFGNRAFVSRSINNYSTKSLSTVDDYVILPDNTSCPRSEVVCQELESGYFDCTCP